MKKTVLYFMMITCIFMCLLSEKSWGQNAVERCTTMPALEERLQNDPDYAAFYQRAHSIAKLPSELQRAIPCDAGNTIRVPIAFHFDESFSCNDVNCILTEVQDQLDVLNAAYGDNTGSAAEAVCPAAYQDANGNSVASTGTCIEFYMPQPPVASGLGACDLPITINQFNGGFNAGGSGAGAAWAGIMNIFITNDGCLGVADGIPGSANGDGVSVCSGAFGGTGGSAGCGLDNAAPFNLGATLTHEVGHYLGLFHTHWDDAGPGGSCTDNDSNPPGPFNINDTPVMYDQYYGCPNGCVTNGDQGAPGACAAIEIPTANFMAYTDDACMSMFTEDQAAVLNYWANQLFGSSNLPDAAPDATINTPCGATCVTCDFTHTVDAVCSADETTYTVTVTIAGGTGPFNITESTGTAPESYTGVAAGTYTYTVSATSSTIIEIIDTGAGDCTITVPVTNPCCQLEVVLDLANVTCELIGGEIIPTIPFTQTGGIGTVWIDQDGNTTFDAGTDIDMTAGINLGFAGPDLNLTIYDSGNPECVIEVVAPYGDYNCEGVAEGDPPLIVCNFTFEADIVNYVCNGDGTATVNLTVDEAAGNITFDQTVSGAYPNYTVEVPVGGACSSTFSITASDDGADISTSAIVEITSPATIAGGVQTVGTNVVTDWGIDINTVSPCVAGTLVAPVDGTAPDTDFCEPAPPGTPTAAQCNGIAGQIAIIDRGSCNFTTKAENAQSCGAVAVVICNNDTAAPDAILNMSGTSNFPITIPTVSLSYNQCQTIYAEMANGDVDVCIGAPAPTPCERTLTINTCLFDCEPCTDCADPLCTTTRPCDDNDCTTDNDMETVLNDGTECVVCAGTPIPPPPCDEDVCTNGGAYIYDTDICECVLNEATLEGCLDPDACNYNPNANCSDGNCIYTTTCETDPCTNGGTYIWDAVTCACVLDEATIEGCTNPDAPNYVPTANCDDGSCECTPDGCIDPNACNFDDMATCDDGSCVYTQTCDADPCTNGGIYIWDDMTCACVLSELTEEGCNDPNACNFDSAANCDDGSCIYETTCDTDPCTNGGTFVWDPATCACVFDEPGTGGCIDPNACNFDNTATCDDGTCIFETACDDDFCTNGGTTVWDAVTCACVADVATVEGCTDPTACNFEPTANCDNGTCIFETQCNSDCTSGDIEIWDPATCACVPTGDPSMPGCNDPAACNFDSNANCDDGSCVYETTCDTDICTNGGSFVWDTATCACVLDVATIEGCTDPAACNFDANANCNTGCIFETACNSDCLLGDLTEWDAVACACVVTEVSNPGCLDSNATNYDPNANCDDPSSCIFDVPGCPDANADNYDPTATTDDGTCEYSGCTDVNAPNYNPQATTDDGSCLPANPAGCNITYVANDISQGNAGGIGVFYYNTTEVIVSGGTAPYTYDWDATGYVRNAIMSSGVVKVISSDNATWCVTVTDAAGCMVVVCEDVFNGSGLATTTIDIISSDITSATNFQATGSIDIAVGGGTQPYTYQWSNGSTAQDVFGLSSGWYSVTVCDGDGMCTEGWYWVPNARPSGRGKIDGTNLKVYPNPLESLANIEFSVAQEENVNITLYTLDGLRIIDIYKGNVEAGVANKISFEAGPIPTGVYLLEMRTESGISKYQKVIVAK